MRRGSEDRLETGDGNETEFAGSPVKCECPYCHESIVTFTKKKSSWLGWLAVFLAIIFTGPLACVLGPLLYHWAKDTAHSCPRCLNRVATVPAVSLPQLWTSDILTFRFGGCACVITWKYLVTGMSIFWLFLFLRFALRPSIGEESTATVADFLKICGRAARAENPLSCHVGFPRDFGNKSVKWRAKINSIEGGGGLFPFITVELDPAEFLVLTLPAHLHAAAAELKPGNDANFHGTFVNAGPPPTLYLHDIQLA